MLSFSDYRFGFERQPLIRPFHFKGGYFTEKWINVVRLDGDMAPGSGTASAAGAETVGQPAVGPSFTGIGGNAVLWSDPAVFGRWSEDGGNALMTLLAERAVQIAQGQRYENPIQAFQKIRPELHDYARQVTASDSVTPTFTLNAMVALDLALWKTHARGGGTEVLRDLIPPALLGGLSASNRRLARVPLISYNVPIQEALALAEEGHPMLKIKIGQSGDPEEMLAKDLDRIRNLHLALEDRGTAFYLDANGRYPRRDLLEQLIEVLDREGILTRVQILEEPFPPESRISVRDLPVRVAADESLHDVNDLTERLELGYGALALKPAGKTLSLSILMAAMAAERDVPCFVADSACVPLLLDWNRLLAAHLPPFPGVGTGLIESNGAQNYGNWGALLREHPIPDAGWLEPRGGVFHLDDRFFQCSGGVFRHAGHYEDLVSKGN